MFVASSPRLIGSAAIVVASLLLAACAPNRVPLNTQFTSEGQVQEVGAPIPGDNRPHPGVKKARSLPIQGMDVARYQGRIDYAKVYASGIHFVYMKMTEGKDYIDPGFYENWNAARQAGVARGAYHFMTWCSLASEPMDVSIRRPPSDMDGCISGRRTARSTPTSR